MKISMPRYLDLAIQPVVYDFKKSLPINIYNTRRAIFIPPYDKFLSS